MTLADGETLKLGFARGGSFSYLAIEGGIAGEPMFGSLAVNARAGLGSPYPRPLQAGDELQIATASGAAERRIDLPAAARSADPRGDGSAGRRIRRGPKSLFLDSEWKISATSDRMGYRLEGPVIKHLHGHNIVSDGTVNGSIQVPGNGAPIVLMPDRGTSGGYPKIATVISADFGRFAQIRPAAVSASRPSVWRRRRLRRASSRNCCAPCPIALRAIENFDLNIEALQDANVAGAAVSAVDAGTWQIPSPADTLAQDYQRPLTQADKTMTTIDLNCDLGESFGAWEMGNDAAMIELATSVNVACGFHAGDADIMRQTVSWRRPAASASAPIPGTATCTVSAAGRFPA